jgi:hypothetical protein
MLPESARTDNEHIRMFQTVLNTHLSQLLGVLSLATILTAVALDFDEIMIMVISEFQPNQWSQQVNDSLELQMTYGKVISAGLFLLFVSMLRYLVPMANSSRVVRVYLQRILRISLRRNRVMTSPYPK